MKKYAIEEAIEGKEIRVMRKKLGLTQQEFAVLANVSVKTIERWEVSDKLITGPIVTLTKLLTLEPAMEQRLEIPAKVYPLRLAYMHHNEVCTVIDVHEFERKVKICNYTSDPLMCAFGRNMAPTYEDYEAFLESRCFPRSRDKMKLFLQELDLPFYDPFLIIEKTQGRMAEDHFWIRIER